MVTQCFTKLYDFCRLAFHAPSLISQSFWKTFGEIFGTIPNEQAAAEFNQSGKKLVEAAFIAFIKVSSFLLPIIQDNVLCLPLSYYTRKRSANMQQVDKPLKKKSGKNNIKIFPSSFFLERLLDQFFKAQKASMVISKLINASTNLELCLFTNMYHENTLNLLLFSIIYFFTTTNTCIIHLTQNNEQGNMVFCYWLLIIGDFCLSRLIFISCF